MRAAEFDSLYLVAVEFTGAGSPGAQVGVWATNDLHTGWILSVDTSAMEVSDWGRASISDPRIATSDAVTAAKKCLDAA